MSNLRLDTLESLGSGNVFEVSKLGYTFEYAADVMISSYSQTIKDGDLIYRVSGITPLPYATTGLGMPEGGAFVQVGDAVLRQDLANPDMGAAMVGYAGGTVADRLGETISVKDFGAKGDGVADDRAAIQAAVDSAAISGGVVFLPAGTYRITGQINWKTKVSLKGMGAGISIIKMDGNLFDAIRNIESGTEGGTDGIDPLDDCHFEDFEIDGTGLTYTQAAVIGKGIFINYMRRAVFRNLYIHHTIGTGLGCDFHKDTVIDSCIVSYCGRNFGNGASAIGQSGIGIGSGWGEDDYLTISNCFTNYNGNHGIFLEVQIGGTDTTQPFARGTRVVNCYAKGNRIGIANRFSGGMTIAGCQAIENTLNNYRIANTLHDYNTLTNCRSERSGGDGFYLENTSAYTKLSSCVSVDDAGRGFYVSGTLPSNAIPGGIGIHLADCSAFNSGSHGISIAYGQYLIQGMCVISGCHVVGSADTGIIASRVSNLSIKSSDIKNNKRGVKVAYAPAGSLATISGCDIIDNVLIGVSYEVAEGSGAFTLMGCVVVNNASKSGGGTADQVSLSSSQAIRFLIDSNKIGGSTDSPDFKVGIRYNLVNPDASALVTNNDLRHNSVNGYLRSGTTTGSAIVRNNAGYNYRPLSTVAIGVSPSIVGPEAYDAMYYINGETVTATVEGGSPLSGGNMSIFVPAGLGLTIEHTGPTSVLRQML